MPISSNRPDGNVLFYSTGDEGDLAQIEGLGGIRYQLLTHRDEAAPSLEAHQGTIRLQHWAVAPRKRRLPAGMRRSISSSGRMTAGLGDIDVLHTPGHTDGSLCFFYRSPHGKSYLFSGDTIFHWNGKWATLVLSKAGGSKAALADSLLQLRELDPDLVLSSGFVGNVAMAAVTRDEWTEAIDSNVRRLKRASR